MRTLAAISLSFAAAVFAAVLLPWSGWTWWAAIVCGAMGLAAVLLRRRLPDQLRLRAAVILFSLCGGLLYFGGYQALVQQPVLERCGREAEFSAVAADFGQLTEQGGRVTVYPEGLRASRRSATAARSWPNWSRDSGSPATPAGRMPGAFTKTT